MNPQVGQSLTVRLWNEWRHHLAALTILGLVGLWAILLPPWAKGVDGKAILLPQLMPELLPGNLGTRFFGYGALVLLGLALSLGPLTRLQPQRFARWLPYRRAVGIWSAISAGIHLLFVLQLVSGGMAQRTWLTLFVKPSQYIDGGGKLQLSYQLYLEPLTTVAWFGLFAFLLLLLIALVSNNPMQRFLGAATWKLIQQWSYTAFIFTSLHLLVMRYGGKLKGTSPLARWALWLALIVGLLQAAGFLYTIWKRRKQHGGKEAAA